MLDSQPGFDATGLTVGLLVIAGVCVVLIGGGASIARAWLLGVVLGGPTPVLEIANGGQSASLAALVFALGATLVTAFAVRMANRDA